MRVIPAVLMAALAAGCAGLPASAPAPASIPGQQPGVNLSGYPPAFRAGYADGCASIDAARRRNETRFKSDADYAQGWRDGYDICRRRR